MKFSDEGIIINQKKYSENSLIVKIFSRQHGFYSGFVKMAKSNKAKAIFQLGNLVSFEFRSGAEENLGQFVAVDLVKSFCTKIIFDRLRLDCANSLFLITSNSFLERENHQNFFEKFLNFLEKVSDERILKEEFLADYVRLELEILKELGYEIDLSSCVVTNSKENLAFVSPKSARAVSFSVGEKYQNKLLKLPNFLTEEDGKCDEKNIVEGLVLSGFFLEKFLSDDGDFSKNKRRFFHRENIKKILFF
jgi:DNA repair protein RecO (recombination protein O)